MQQSSIAPRLQREQVRVAPVEPHQLRVTAALDDAPAIEHHDLVRHAHRGEAVRDENGDAIACELPEMLKHLGLRLCVHGGGQWQKIALSRAFMRIRADILVLDEPTAAMDAQAEAEVFEHFRQLARDRITILISHRFSTVRMADQIVVLNRGRIVERGSHEELMRLDGRYAHLFALQARGYR